MEALKAGQGPQKGQNAALSSSVWLFWPGNLSSRAGRRRRRRGYSNSSWKCLIRPSPPSLRQSAISGADMGTRHWLLFKNQGRRNRKERLLDKHRQLGERLPEQLAECQCSHVDNYKHECTRTSANKHTFFYYLNLVFLSTETHWHIFDKYSLHSKLLHNIACQLNQNCRTFLELHHFECLSYTSAAKLCRAYAANVSD